MWRSDVVVEEAAPADPVDGAERERLLRKAVALGAAYAVGAAALAFCLAKLGLSNRWWRGAAVVCGLWAVHLWAASGDPSRAEGSSLWGRALLAAADFVERRPFFAKLLFASPLAAGILALPWGSLGSAALGMKAAKAVALWLLGVGMCRAALSALSPSELGLIEASGASSAERSGAAAARTWADALAALGFWWLFCKAAGWL